ncbi:MAG: FecR family protein [Acidiferrobacterales bacterium]
MTKIPATNQARSCGLPGLAFLLLALFALAAPVAHAAVVGKALVVSGQVVAQQPDGSTRALVADAVIERGDTIISAADSAAQLRFIDGALVTLHAATRFRIDDYYYADGSARDHSFFSLLKGGLRTLSGLIGKARHAAYRLDTPVATVGIRGTDYQLRLCHGDCPPGNPDGLYLGVGYGAIAVVNRAGSFNLKSGQYGYLKDATSRLQYPSCPPEPLTGVACPDQRLSQAGLGSGYPTGDQDPISGDRPAGLGIGQGCGGSITGALTFALPVPPCP